MNWLIASQPLVMLPILPPSSWTHSAPLSVTNYPGSAEG
ncbi:hypothetical protein Pd630_LPD06326 [Rhodococcus opacus PD630]|nr:hypothetical protein Pd630_LPD06326 [Rhodococcus opacus PD630]